jgi:hypothetical protein
LKVSGLPDDDDDDEPEEVDVSGPLEQPVLAAAATSKARGATIDARERMDGEAMALWVSSALVAHGGRWFAPFAPRMPARKVRETSFIEAS